MHISARHLCGSLYLSLHCRFKLINMNVVTQYIYIYFFFCDVIFCAHVYIVTQRIGYSGNQKNVLKHGFFVKEPGLI